MKRISFKFTSFEWILIGLIIHAIGRIFFQSSKPVCYLICALGLFIVFFNFFFRVSYQIPFSGIVRFLFYFYLLWSIGIVIRPIVTGENLNRDGYSLINQYTWLAYFVPCICFINSERISLKSIFRFSFISGIIGIGLLIVFYNDIFKGSAYYDDESYQAYIGITGIPTSFLVTSAYCLLWFAFLSRPYKFVSFLTWCLGIFTTAYAARRGGVFNMLLLLTLFIFQYLLYSKNKVIQIVLAVLIVAVLGTSILTFINSNFSLLVSRAGEDTRSGVEEFFFQSFQGKELDWLVGRGINGTYYCPIFRNPNRDVIETGYLHMILKGGLIYLLTFILFLLFSMYLGFFKSKNTMTRAMAFYIFMRFIALIPFGLPSFTFEYVVLWIFIAFCQSSKFRSFNDQAIKRIFIPKDSIKKTAI